MPVLWDTDPKPPGSQRRCSERPTQPEPESPRGSQTRMGSPFTTRSFYQP